MSDIRYQILGELYRLLGSFHQKDFMATSRLPEVHGELLKILELFALLTKRIGPPKSIQESSKRRKPIVANDRIESSYSSIQSLNYRLEEFLKAKIYDKRRFVSKAQIVQFAKSQGIDLNFRPKENRIRAANRLIKHIIEMPQKKQKQMIQFLASQDDKQTSGWFDLIRGLYD